MRFNLLHPTASARAILCLGLVLGTAIAGSAWATIDFTFTTSKAVLVGETGLDYVKLHCEVTNTGTEADQYDILRIVQNLPAGWQSSICVGGEDGICQAPFVDSLYAGTPPCPFPSCGGPSGFGLAPAAMDSISCYITPDGPEGSGYVTFRVRSVANPAVARDLTVGCVTDGVIVLLVDDDGTQTLETYYQAAVPTGVPHGTWRRSAQSLTAADLQNFSSVVWFTGNATPTLDASDRTAITGYLAGNRGLVLSGQDIAYDLCDPASPNYSAANVTWYETTLKSRYVNDNSASLNLVGVAGDPVSNGLNLAIQGGSGANNQTDPDVIRPLTGAGTIWTYQTGGGTAATRVLGSGYRAVNLGFGFEAIANAANREAVMTQALTWMAGSPIGIEDQAAGSVPGAFRLEPARPNPFNPHTEIAFALDRPATLRLRILDATGRTVRVLAAGDFAAGRHARAWDGRDGSGREMASGMYLAELTVDGGPSQQVKLNLVR